MEVLLLTITVFLISTVHNVEFVNETLVTGISSHQCRLSEHSRQRRSFYSTKESLYCPPCEQIHCYKQRKKRLYCKGGYTVGVCGCCRVCAKVEGENCGGDHDYLGKCDKGLFCEPQPPKEVNFKKDGIQTTYTIHRGICRKAYKKKSPDQCKPVCDPEYCSKNPRAICSAKENAENLNECQGICQHTSCRACRFVEPEQQCEKCKINDFKCIRDFGRCIRKKLCKPQRYPCGNKTAVKKGKLKFLCFVPECSS